MPVTVEVVARGHASLIALGPEWRELEVRSSPNIFLTYAWLSAWWRTRGRSTVPYVLAVRDAHGNLVGLAPFSVHSSQSIGPQRIRTLRSPGGRDAGRLGVLAAIGQEAAVYEAIVRHFESNDARWHTIELEGIALDSPEAAALTRGLGRGHVVAVQPGRPAPYLPIRTTWDTYVSELPRKKRYELGRRRRRFNEDLNGHVVECTDSADVRATLEFLFDRSIERHARDGKSSAFADADTRAFHLDAAEALFKLDRAVVHRLEVGGEIAAVSYSLRHGDVMWYYNAAYDPRWSSYGLGRTLLGFVIEYAFASGASEVDFGRGDQPYKSDWTSHRRDIGRLVIDKKWVHSVRRSAKWIRAVRSAIKNGVS